MRNYKKLISLFAAVAMTVTGLPVTAMAAPEEIVNVPEGYSYLEGYTKQWGDEFDVSGDGTGGIASADWNVETHEPGWVNSEWQAYVDSTENIKVENGKLKLIPQKAVASGLEAGEEILENNFSGESLEWPWYNASGDTNPSVTVADGKVRYDITGSESGHAWDNQLCRRVALEKGAKYELTFKVTSTIDRAIDVKVQHYDTADNGYNQNEEHASKHVELTANQQTDVSLDVVTKAGTDPNANIAIQMGNYMDDWNNPKVAYNENHSITLSDFSLKVIEAPNDSYTSGRINTQNKQTFKYGLFEAKVKVPTGAGYLPAFWLMPNTEETYGQWPRCGEIDCMEVMGQETNKVYGTIHYGNPHNENQGTAIAKGDDFATTDHIFACEWLPGKIIWYVDGEKYYETSDWFSATEGQGKVTYPAPFDQEFYVILNLAVGGSWVGNPNESTEYGDDHAYEVDYVRVYQKPEEFYEEAEKNLEEPVKEEVELREPDETGNYVINGDFAVKEDLVEEKDWVFKTALEGNATAEIKDKSIVINTTAAGTADYSVQLYQANVPFEKGATYEVSFDAKASAPRTMNVDIKAPDHSYAMYMDTMKPALTTDMQTFTQEFKMTSDSDANGRLEFNMGATNSTATITIGNVTVKKVEGPEDEEEDDTKTILADGNYVYNGKFQEGKNYLGYWDINKSDDTSAKVTGLKDGRRLKVELPKDPEEPFVLAQDKLAIKSGKDYSVSFLAQADKEARLDVSVGGKNKTIKVATGDAKEYSFKIPNSAKLTNSDLRIRVSASEAVTVYLDNISITEDKILKNGDFNDSWTGFSEYAADGVSYTKGIDSIAEGNDNAAEFTIKNTGDENWKIQLIQYIDLKKDKTYKLKYDAKSSINRTIWAQIQHDPDNAKLPGHDGDYTNYAGTSPVALTDKWQTFETTFTMSEDNPKAKFNICLGAPESGSPITTQHIVTVDNISVVEVSGGEGGDTAAAETVCEIADVVYTGAQLKPEVKVYDEDVLLTANKDYTVKYFNNVNANATRKVDTGMGENFNEELPYAKITFKGNYKGEQKVNFNINRKPIANSSGDEAVGTVLTYLDQVATSAKKDQAVFKSLKVDKKSLKAADYTVTLLDPKGAAIEGAKVPKNGSGKYTLKVKGKGNYSGTIVKTVYVAEKNKLLKNAKIAIGKNEKKKVYTGKNIKLRPGYYDKTTRKTYEIVDENGTVSANSCDAKDVFTVKAGNESLKYGVDYTVKYTNNKTVGKATLEIIGKGDYCGNKSIKFDITGIPFNSKTVVVADIAPQDYTGSAIKPRVRASYKLEGDKTKPLYSGTNYTVTYTKNINKGKATVILTGKASSGYTGTVKKTFVINGLKLEDMTNATLSENTIEVFTKGGAKLDGNKVVLKNKGVELVAGKDYVVKKCINNKKPANYNDATAPTATIAGKGNYVGTIDIKYSIVPADVNDIDIVAATVAYNANATKAYAPKVTVKQGKKALKKDTDYTITYENCEAASVKSYIEKTSDKAPKAIVSGKLENGYTGTKEVPLQIYVNKMSAKNTVIYAGTPVFRGKQVKPEVEVYFSTDKAVINQAKKAIAEGKGETLKTMQGLSTVSANNISVSYGKNDRAGMNAGSVTVKGTSCEYFGTVTAKFNISEYEIKNKMLK